MEENSSKKTNNKSKTFEMLAFFNFFLMEIYVCLPILRGYLSGTIFKILFFFLSVVTLLFAGVASKKWSSVFLKKICFFALLYLLIVLLNVSLGRYSSYVDIISALDFLVLYLFIGVGFFFIMSNNKSINNIIIYVFVACAVITIFTTLLGLNINQNYSRILTSSSTPTETISYLRKLNIGAYDFIYSLVLVSFLFVKIFPFEKNKAKKIVVLLILISSVFCIIKSNFTIALLLLIVSGAFCLVSTKSSSNRFIIRLAITALILYFVAKPIVLYLLNFFEGYFSSIYAKMKIKGMISVINGTESLGEVTSRTSLIANSLNTIRNYPVIGRGVFYHSLFIIGGHSQILDDIARYGLLGYSIIIYPIIYYLKTIFDRLKAHYKNILFVIVLLYVVLSIINVSLPYYISLTTYIIIPIVLCKYSDSEGND